MITETERAWAAGFFDGEGNIRCALRDGTRAVLTLQISQIDPFVLERFRLMAGVGAVRGPYKGTNKDVYKFECSGADAISAFDAIKPYLSIPKLMQGEQAKQDYHIYKYKK